MLDALRARLPWRNTAYPMLRRCGLYAHRGWEDTINAFETEKLSASQVSALRSALEEHLIVGEKCVRIYKVGSANAQKLRAIARSSAVKQTDLTKSFPYVLPEKKLRELGGEQPTFTRHIERPEGEAALFSGSRAYLEHVKLNVASLKAAVVGDDEYTSLSATRERQLQTYDSIWMPFDSEFICINVDFPATVQSDFYQPSFDRLESWTRKVIGDDLVLCNLWQSIEDLYSNGGGKLVELGFVTDEEGVKHHRSRGGKCLRRDLYHRKGAAAVGDALDPYRIAIKWRIKQGEAVVSNPELFLPGTARMLFKPQLSEAVLRNAYRTKDMEFVLNKLAGSL